MSDLQTFIEDCLNIPYIPENQAIMDGSFMITPYMVESLKGDGKVQNVTVLSSVELFYEDKSDAVENGILLSSLLNEENNYVADDPDFTFENEAQIWRTTVRVQEVINND